jgi:hypothetical protein
MIFVRSCQVLGIDGIESGDITLDTLKRHYKMKALQYHPDKNKSVDASAKFQEIHDAYEYLMRYQGYWETGYSNELNDDNRSPGRAGYQWILEAFLKTILKEETRSSLYYTILNRIVMTCEKKALDTLSKLEKSTLFKTYEILMKYKDTLHFSEPFLKRVLELIQEKVKGDECIILNPTIDDLIENNLFKLTMQDEMYIIPLWHHELVYDVSGNDLYVKCNPMLPENITIDEDNNLHISLTLKISDIWEKEWVDIEMEQHKISVSSSDFKVMKHQIVLLAKQGITKINVVDIYDITQKSDVYLNVTMIL